MKRFTTLLSLFAMAVAVVSCSTDDLEDATLSGGSSADEGGAFVSLTISTATATRATDLDGKTENATTEESGITSVILLAFDESQDLIGAYEGVEDTSDKSWLIEVSAATKHILAIANPNDVIKGQIDVIKKTANKSWSVVYAALYNTALSLSTSSSLTSATGGDIATNNYFPMVNEGSYNSTGTNSVLKYISKMSTDKGDPTEVDITVDRLAAKFTCTASTLSVSDGIGSNNDGNKTSAAKYVGVRLNATNRLGVIYSPITTMTRSNCDYRVDPNMSIEFTGDASDASDVKSHIEVLEANFNWLSNSASSSNDQQENENTVAGYFNTESNATEYVLENTASAAYQDYSNLTQAIVCIEYVPGDLIEGLTFTYSDVWSSSKDIIKSAPNSSDTWYTITTSDGIRQDFTFEGVVAFYQYLRGKKLDGSSWVEIAEENKSYTNTDANNAIADVMDYQLQHIMGDNTSTWASVTKETLEAKPNLGYVAATVGEYTFDGNYNQDGISNGDKTNAYVVAIYKGGKNYYDVFIQHDSDQEVGAIGRWGMVRNNWYTLNINSVSGPGLPYIPDPTDQDITDPKNPDPTNPDPADTENGFLDVTLVMNLWTTWSQDATLGDSDF